MDQRKLRSRLAIAKSEIADTVAEKVRLPPSLSLGYLSNGLCFYPRKGWRRMFSRPSITRGSSTLPSGLGQCDSASQPSEGSSDPSTASAGGVSMAPETSADIDSDPFAIYFSDWDPNTPPKVLITTSKKRQKRHTPFARNWWSFSLVLNSSGGRRDEDSRLVGLRGGLQTEYIRRRWS